MKKNMKQSKIQLVISKSSYITMMDYAKKNIENEVIGVFFGEIRHYIDSIENSLGDGLKGSKFKKNQINSYNNNKIEIKTDSNTGSNRIILLITEAYPIRVGLKTTVDFTDEDYEQLIPIIKEQLNKGNEWLGWFHSHPFPGDHLYLSKRDQKHQKLHQVRSEYFVAIVINPYQENDPENHGLKAFQLKMNNKRNRIKKVIELNVNFQD